METVTLKVGGMTCQGCVRSVTKVLENTPGVQTALVSLEQAQAEVTYDPGKSDIDRLKAAIEAAGYDAP